MWKDGIVFKFSSVSRDFFVSTDFVPRNKKTDLSAFRSSEHNAPYKTGAIIGLVFTFSRFL